MRPSRKVLLLINYRKISRGSEETGGILHEHGLKPPVLKFTNMGYLG